MTNTKTTKRSLFSSVVALLLCFSMLLGTTYAWFTDSATSDVNTIVAGNLDVVLTYSVWEPGAGWVEKGEVDPNVPVFNENALWEPGYTEAVKFNVKNNGTLALKYNMAVTVYDEVAGTNVFGQSYNLSDYIYVAETASIASRADAVAAVANAGRPLEGGYNLKNGLATNLSAGQSEEFVLVLSMPSSVDNVANPKADTEPPQIKLGIQLVATQYTQESDDFGPNYDANATYPANILISTSVEDVNDDNLTDAEVSFEHTDTSSSISKVEVTVPASTKLANGATELVLKIEEKSDIATGVSVNSNQTATTYDIKIEGVATDNTAEIEFVLQIQPGLTGVELWHNNALMDDDDYEYNPTNGELKFKTTGFSDFTVVHKNVANEIATAAELMAAVAKGGTYSLTDDIAVVAPLNVEKDLVILGNNHTLTFNYTGNLAYPRAIDVPEGTCGANLTLKDLVIDCSNNYFQRGINYNTNGTLVLNNVTVSGATYAVNLPSCSDDAKVEITNCNLTGLNTLNIWGENCVVNVTDSTLTSVEKNDKEDYKAVSLNRNQEDGAHGAVVTITGGSIIARNENDEPSTAVGNLTQTGKVIVSDTTEVVGEIRNSVALVTYGEQPEFYSCYTLEDAIETAAQDTTGTAKVVLIRDVVVNQQITIPKGATVVLDLGGNTLSGAFDNKGSSALIYNQGTLTIMNGTVVSLAEYPDVDWGTEGYPTYATNTITNRGTLTIEEGTIIENQTNVGGASYAIDNQYSWAGVPSVLTVNGGEIIAKDVAIRLCASTADYDNSVTIKGGTITGKRAVWIHLTGSDANVAPNATLTITGGNLTGTSELAIYSYSYGNSFANTAVTINGGTFNGDVQFGGGYKGDTEKVTITGGTFNGALGRWLENNGWEDIAKP